MRTMQGETSVAANSTSANVLAGLIEEFLENNSQVALYCTASQVDLDVTMIVGGEVAIDASEINTQNRQPVVPDDFLSMFGGFAGDRVILRAANRAGTATTFRWRVEITPLG